MQPGLNFARSPRFDGAAMEPRDHARLADQIRRVYTVLTDGKWWAVHQIAAVTGDPEPSISAQLRNLRKARFGGYDVRRKRESNLSYYRLVRS